MLTFIEKGKTFLKDMLKLYLNDMSLFNCKGTLYAGVFLNWFCKSVQTVFSQALTDYYRVVNWRSVRNKGDFFN